MFKKVIFSIIVLGSSTCITAQQSQWNTGHMNPARAYAEAKNQEAIYEKALKEAKYSKDLRTVKKYNIPEIAADVDRYTAQNFSDLVYKITPKIKSKLQDYYIIDYQDYQDIIEFFQQVVVSAPNEENFNYEAEGDKWSISLHKTNDLKYFGRIKISNKLDFKNYGPYSIRETTTLLFAEDVFFLASLPLDIQE